MGVWIEMENVLLSPPDCQVTPCMGVWIEIRETLFFRQRKMSLPVWECGLKFYILLHLPASSPVTPCMGVWIEITLKSFKSSRTCVTPCMGVWIEIKIRTPFTDLTNVTPCMGVWIEILRYIAHGKSVKSHSLYGSVD